MTLRVSDFRTTSRFEGELKSASADAQAAAKEAIALLLSNPKAGRLRLHQLKGYKPSIWVIDVYANHSWQITFEMQGETAILRRLATHKNIDRDPKGA
jgi:hypothetical protein